MLSTLYNKIKRKSISHITPSLVGGQGYPDNFHKMGNKLKLRSY